MPGSTVSNSSGSRKRTSNLWKQAYKALNDEEKGRERLHRLNTMLKEELGKPKMKLRSEDGYQKLLGLIQEKARQMENSKSTEKIGRVCKNMMVIQDIVAAGANVAGPYVAIPAAALFLAFSMNDIYLGEKAAMYELAETVADYVVLSAKAQDRIKLQASDDEAMLKLKENLHMVYIGLYKAIIFASAQLMIALNADFQWLKNVAKHYDWAGQLETLNRQQHRIEQYRAEMESKVWQEVSKPTPAKKEKLQEPKPDPKKDMGPGPRNPLHWAAAVGVPEQVLFYVQNREYPINALTPQGWTAAHLAAREGHTKILKTLFTAPGIDLTIKNREGRTPLHIAAIHNRKWATKALLERHCRLLGVRDRYDRTAFILAAEKGNVKVLEVLKNYGQDMNETTVKQGWSALHLAAENGKVDAVKWLVANGTKKWTKVKDGPQKGLTAKQIAELKGRADVVEVLCTQRL